MAAISRALVIFSAAAVTALALAAPVFLLGQVIGQWSFAERVLTEPATWRFLRSSVLLGVTVGLTTMLIGLAAAWLTVRLDLPRPWRLALTVLLCMPLIMPSYVAAFGLIVATGPNGLLGPLLPEGFILRDFPFLAAWLVLSSCTYPYAFLAARAALLRQCGSLEDAAVGLGASRAKAFFRITVPRIVPSLTWGGLLSGLYCLADFGAVSMIGYETMTWAIYNRYTSALAVEEARVLALILAVVAVVVILIMRRVRPVPPSTSSATLQPQTPVRRHPLAIVPLALVLAAVVCGAFLPLASAVQLTAGGGSGDVVWVRTFAEATSTLVLAVLAAVLVVVLTFPLTSLEFGRDRLAARWFAPLTMIGFALPGLVVAVAAVGIALLIDQGIEWVFRLEPGRFLYQSSALLLFAYAAMFLPEAVGPMQAASNHVHPEQVDAGRQLDGRPWRVWRRVLLPQLTPGIVAGAALVFVTTAKELPATLLLAPPNVETLATSIWSNMQEAELVHAAHGALWLVAICAAGLLVVFRMERRGHLTAE